MFRLRVERLSTMRIPHDFFQRLIQTPMHQITNSCTTQPKVLQVLLVFNKFATVQLGTQVISNAATTHPHLVVGKHVESTVENHRCKSHLWPTKPPFWRGEISHVFGGPKQKHNRKHHHFTAGFVCGGKFHATRGKSTMFIMHLLQF